MCSINMTKAVGLLLCLLCLLPDSACQNTGDLQLHLGTDSSGIVQVYDDDNTWKTICGRNLGQTEAGVICRHLGFQDGRALPMSAYGVQHDLVPYQHKLKQCQTGSESRLLSCEFDYNTTCADETVSYGSVSCLTGTQPPTPGSKLRLGLHDPNTASQYFSPLSVYDVTMATWGKICVAFWDDIDADVACRQLGYSGGKASVGNTDFTVPYLLFEVICNGSEASLDECEQQSVFCYDQRSAGVVCYNQPSQAPEVNLVGGKLYGTVVLTVDGQTGYICNSSYHGSLVQSVNNDAASVICQYLGFSTGVVVDGSFIGGSSTGEVVLESFECEAGVTSPFRCTNQGWKNLTTQCQDVSMALSVACSTTVTLEDQASFDATIREGVPIIIDNDGKGHRVCYDALTQAAGDTICRQLGFDVAEILVPTYLDYVPSGDKDVTSITCSGTALDIESCDYTIGKCPQQDFQTFYAKLFCRKASLTEDVTPSLKYDYNGQVLLTRYGMIGNICEDDWTDKEAAVVCHQAGYQTGVVLGGSSSQYYFQRYPIWKHTFSCLGTETQLLDCPYTVDKEIPLDCYNRPAGALCFNNNLPDAMVRLVGSGSSGSDAKGRVELYVNGTTWGVICGSTGINTANVICKQLGYPGGQMSGSSNSGSSTVAMSSVRCQGTETSIYQCANRGWLVSTSCTSSSANNVFCYTHVKIDVIFYGRVLVHSGENYGLVCADTFDQTAANVVCKEAGFVYGVPLCCSAFGPTDYSFTRVGMKCLGTENSLKDCPYENGATCSSNQYASVVCGYAQLGYTGVRVTPLVRVTYFSHDGYVCSENFTDNDALVACRSEGFQYGLPFKHSTTGLASPLRWLRGLKCSGTENDVQDCGPHTWGQIGVCDVDSLAAAHCTNTEENLKIDVRLVAGTTISGRVEVKLDGQWGTMCGKDLTKSEAVVICRQLGFHDGITLEPGYYGSGQGDILLSRIQCGANDRHIHDCIWSGFKNPSSLCTHSLDAAVKCFYNTRLAGSPLQNYGRLEVFDDDVNDWVLVCDRALAGDTPTQVCRQLGYVTGLPQSGSPLGPTDKPIVFSGTSCPVSSPCNFTKGSCLSNHYIALYCSEANVLSEGAEVRLPQSAFYGPVSIKRFGLWGHICNIGFDDGDATVVCSQLNYRFGRATTTLITEGIPIIQGRVECTDGETSIANCEKDPFSKGHECYDFKTVAGVICYDDTTGLKFLSDDLDPEGGQMTTLVAIEANNEEVYVLENSVSSPPENAAVYCSSLGFAGGQETRLTTSSPKFSVAQIECSGDEETILDCVGDWSPSTTVGRGKSTTVTCFKTVRLVGGNSSFYGVVYASKGVNSGPVCANGFDQTAADLTCTDLGWEHSVVFCCSPFGVQEATPIMDNIDCSVPLTPGEGILHLTDCYHDDVVPARTEACQKNYAAVACYSGNKPTEFTVSLSEAGSNTGYVVLTYLGIAGVICLDGWDDDDATVVCKELGYNRGLAYNADRGQGKGPFWTSEVECSGTEQRLSECRITEVGTVGQCSHALGHAGVICYDDEGIFYRLQGADEERWGRVEIALNGEWRSLCNLHWENVDAHVLCKHLGYRAGEVYTQRLSVTIGGPVWETNFQCSGTESSLNECISSGWRASTLPSCAQHLNDAAAFCYKSVKLSTGVGRETTHGAVLLYKGDQWYKVCGSRFSDQSARAVCRELGFVDGQSKSGSPYGSLPQYQLLTSHTVSCFGDELDVSDCLIERICPGTEYASVTCFSFELNPEDNPTTTPASKFDSLPIILAVVIFVVLVIVAIAAVCLYRRYKGRTSSKSSSSHPFNDGIIQYRRDGSVEATNVLTDNKPESSTSPNPESDYETLHARTLPRHIQPQASAVYDNPVYKRTEDVNRERQNDKNDTVVRASSNPYIDMNKENNNKYVDNSQNNTDATRSKQVEASNDNPLYSSSDNPMYSSLHEKAELHSPRASMDLD